MGFQVVVQSDSIWNVEWTYPFMKLIQSSGFIQSGSQMEVLFDMGRGQVTDWSISTTWYIHLHSIYITWWSNFTEDLERKFFKFHKLQKWNRNCVLENERLCLIWQRDVHKKSNSCALYLECCLLFFSPSFCALMYRIKTCIICCAVTICLT